MGEHISIPRAHHVGSGTACVGCWRRVRDAGPVHVVAAQQAHSQNCGCFRFLSEKQRTHSAQHIHTCSALTARSALTGWTSLQNSFLSSWQALARISSKRMSREARVILRWTCAARQAGRTTGKARGSQGNCKRVAVTSTPLRRTLKTADAHTQTATALPNSSLQNQTCEAHTQDS